MNDCTEISNKISDGRDCRILGVCFAFRNVVDANKAAYSFELLRLFWTLFKVC